MTHTKFRVLTMLLDIRGSRGKALNFVFIKIAEKMPEIAGNEKKMVKNLHYPRRVCLDTRRLKLCTTHLLFIPSNLGYRFGNLDRDAWTYIEIAFTLQGMKKT